MEENHVPASPDTPNEDTNYSPGKQLTVGVGVTLFLVLVGIFGYSYINNHTANHSNSEKSVLNASTSQITPIQSISQNPQNITEAASNNAPTSVSNNSPVATNNKACAKNGPAQKWEYLTPYVVKDGDTIQSIATTQMNDANRVNEILQINGQGPYVVGSTIYLPPSSITQSSGNIKEVYGMLIAKDSSYWHLSYSSDPKGLGILLPSFWFNSISNSNSFSSGDCLKILFDDGNKVYSVNLQ
jgi:hypothetical protein